MFKKQKFQKKMKMQKSYSLNQKIKVEKALS